MGIAHDMWTQEELRRVLAGVEFAERNRPRPMVDEMLDRVLNAYSFGVINTLEALRLAFGIDEQGEKGR